MKANRTDRSEPDMSFVLGLPFHQVTMEQVLADCSEIIETGEPRYMVTGNLDFTRLAAKDSWLHGFLFNAHRVLCDGLPLVWLSKLFGSQLPERVAGSDLVPRLLRLSSEKGYRVYFLGSDEATLAKVSAKLAEDLPELQVAGCHAPPFGPIESWENETIGEEIRSSRADIVLVAVGCPKQERWIAKYHQSSGAALSIGVGASLDFIVGKQVRAPRWMQKIGMEWFWRMARSPRRLIGRYTKDFCFLVGATWRQWRGMKPRRSIHSESYQPISGELVFGFGESMPTSTEVPVCDCSEMKRIDGASMGLLCHYARQANKSGGRLRLTNVPDGLDRLMATFGLGQQFEVLNNKKSNCEDLEKVKEISSVMPA